MMTMMGDGPCIGAITTVLADIEALLARSRPIDEISKVIQPRLKQYLPLSSNTAVRENLDEERRKDHIGHFVLRLAFCRSYVAEHILRMICVLTADLIALSCFLSTPQTRASKSIHQGGIHALPDSFRD